MLAGRDKITVFRCMPVPYWDYVLHVQDGGRIQYGQLGLNRYWVGTYGKDGMPGGCATGLLPEFCRP